MAKKTTQNPDARVAGKLKRKKERVALSRRFRAMTPPGVAQTDSAELIRKDRDSR